MTVPDTTTSPKRCVGGKLDKAKMTTLLDLPFSAINNRFQNGLFSASSKFFGPSARLSTLVTPSTDWSC